MPKASKEFETFTKLIDQIIAVPRAEMERRLAKHRLDSRDNPRKRGPKGKRAKGRSK
jgi:hypothetical protein